MVDLVNFPFVWETNALGESVRRPLIPISLTYNAKTVSAMALLDSGADVSVLPYQLGVELGADWDEQKFTLDLSGNLARFGQRYFVICNGWYSPACSFGVCVDAISASQTHLGADKFL